MIFDKVNNYIQYPYKEIWKQAFTFLQSLNIESEEKRYELDNGMYAMIMSYATKTQQNAVLESHKKYVDIQASLSGAEGIKWFHTNNLEVINQYNPSTDAQFYKYQENSPCLVKNYPGYFCALWPTDAHMPQLKVDDILDVKKVVIKVPLHLL